MADQNANTQDVAYAFPDEASYNRVWDAVRLAEQLAKKDAPGIAQLPLGPLWVWVRVTSASPTDGYYPCRRVLDNADGTTELHEEMYAKVANLGEVLANGIDYPGMIVGTRDVGGMAFAVVKVLGELITDVVETATWRITPECTIVPNTTRTRRFRGTRLSVQDL